MVLSDDRSGMTKVKIVRQRETCKCPFFQIPAGSFLILLDLSDQLNRPYVSEAGLLGCMAAGKMINEIPRCRTSGQHQAFGLRPGGAGRVPNAGAHADCYAG